MFTRYRSAKFVLRSIFLCWVFALFALVPVPLKAQETDHVFVAAGPGPQTAGPGMAGPGIVTFQEKVEVVKGHPYQADAITESIQTLSDGSHITQKITAHVARDSEGRTIRSQTMSGIGPWAVSADKDKQVTFVSIFDPVAGQHIDYSSDSKSAHVLPMPNANNINTAHATFTSSVTASRSMVLSGEGPPPSGVGALAFGGATVLQGPGPAGSASFSPNETTESLGNRSIEGLTAEGTRAKEVIPAGAIGNDKELVSTRETWYSSDLKVVLSSIRNDPRFGEVRYSLSNIQLNPPDPALFQVPAGYSIERPNVHLESRP